MAKPDAAVVKRSLFSWVFGPNTKLQLLLLVLIAITVFARVLPLEMQKRIVNEAIRLRNVDLLINYCAIYLVSVVSASLLKYIINSIQVIISQRTLARMREGLFAHIISLPLSFFRNTQPGMVVSSIVSELALPSNFVGMALAVPVINLLTLMAFAGYLFWLNPWLAALSLSIYPAVIFLVPLLQRRVNVANKKRVDLTRRLSDKVAESISGIHEIHGNGAYSIENRKVGSIIKRLYRIRLRWDLLRAGVKTSNNFFTSLGPFIVFILGGYLTIQGQLELGALVAFLSAQEKLYDPWKELIQFYQSYQDGRVGYDKTMSYFDAEPDYDLIPEKRDPLELEGMVEVKNLTFATGDGLKLLDNISLTLNPGDHLALIGFSGSGKSTLAQCIGQLYAYTGGQVLLGNAEVNALTKRDIVQNMGFVSQSPFIFDGTIEENLLYACEAMNGDRSDASQPSLDDKIQVLHQTGLFTDTLRFGLNTIFNPGQDDHLVEQLIRVRKNFQGQFGDSLAQYVEFFDENRYLVHSSVAANLLFGSPNREQFKGAQLAANAYFLEFLNQADLQRPLIELGADLTRQTIDILGNLPPDKVFFEQSPIAPEELDTFKALAGQTRRKKLHQLDETDRAKLLELALRFTPGRHKMVSFPKLLERLILEGRALFKEKISTDDPGAFSFYDNEQYIFSQTIQNNIFFGKTTTTNMKAQDKIVQSIIHLLIEEDLLETIVRIGMQYQVGSKGDKLSGGQRQKLAIARVFLKSPRLLIMDEATSALDNKSQARIQNFLDTRLKGKATVIAVVHRLDIIKNFDQVAVMKAGKLMEIGTYEDLMARKGVLYELVSGRK
ncbi:MAG: ABC transporter ATP-binding protein/permease [Desulfobacterales bacterium]|nr:ABC transporter ATP-binding protein/permease [Desulfobacterales bacterium]